MPRARTRRRNMKRRFRGGALTDDQLLEPVVAADDTPTSDDPPTPTAMPIAYAKPPLPEEPLANDKSATPNLSSAEKAALDLLIGKPRPIEILTTSNDTSEPETFDEIQKRQRAQRVIAREERAAKDRATAARARATAARARATAASGGRRTKRRSRARRSRAGGKRSRARRTKRRSRVGGRRQQRQQQRRTQRRRTQRRRTQRRQRH